MDNIKKNLTICIIIIICLTPKVVLAIETPILITPEDNVILKLDDFVGNIPLKWSKVPEAATYTVRIKFPGIYKIKDYEKQVTENEYIFPGYLVSKGSQPYYWQVQAKSVKGEISEWSESRTFHLIEHLPELDLNNNGYLEAQDLFQWANYWKTSDNDEIYSTRVDFVFDGKIDEKDINKFFEAWKFIRQFPTPTPSPSPSPTPLQPLAPPVLIYPEDGAKIASMEFFNNFSFSWEAVNGAQEYELEVAGDSFPKTSFYTDETTFKFAFGATILGDYQWRVRTNIPQGQWSEVRFFASVFSVSSSFIETE